jgi:hypothetical protein
VARPNSLECAYFCVHDVRYQVLRLSCFAADADLAGVDRELKFVAGFFGSGVNLDFVQKFDGQLFFAATNGALATAVDQHHQRADVTGGPGVQVVA